MAFIPERQLECLICLSRFTDPYTLPCLHTFCRECITDWLNVKEKCPKCQEHCTLADLKKSFIFSDILNDKQGGNVTFCDNCKELSASLTKCEHCNKSMCSLCQLKHTKEIEEDIGRLCEELKSVTLPQLDDHNMSLAMLMDKATTAKEELVEELAVAYELLASQISRKGDMGFRVLKQMEKRAKQDVDAQIETLDLLIAKIESFSSASTDKIEKGDLNELMELDKEISHLQADVEKFQSEIKNLDPSQNAVPLGSVKVNPVYKTVAKVIENVDIIVKTKEYFVS